MDTNNSIRIAIYSRKSRFSDKGDSTGNQIEIAKEYIRLHYPEDLYNISVTVYEDEGFSGKSFDRPDFKKFLNEERERPYNLLICYRLDRISRNITDFSGLINELSNLGTDFISIKEQFDTKTPMGRAMMYIASVFSQLEREVIAERIKDNLMELSKTGVWLGGIPPFGFEAERYKKVDVLEEDNNLLSSKKKNATKLVVNKAELPIVKLIFNKFLELKSLTLLESYLIRNDIKSRKKVNFSTFSLKWILTNPVYVQNDKNAKKYFQENCMQLFADSDGRDKYDGKYGFMTYNKTTGKKDLPKEKWIVAVGLHPGIISSNDWIATQELIEKNKCKSYSYNTEKGFMKNSIVSGLLFCKECGSKMRAKTSYARKDGSVSYSYVCQLKEKSRGTKCNSKNVYGDRLDNQIINVIKNIIVPNSYIYEELKQMTITDNSDAENNDLVYLENTFEQTTKEIDQLVEKMKYIDIDLMDMINQKLRILKEKKIKIENDINEIRENKKVYHTISDNEKDTAKNILEIIDNSFSIFETFDLKTKKDIASIFIEKIIGEEDRVEIYLLNTSFNKLKKKLFITTSKHEVENFSCTPLSPEGGRFNSHCYRSIVYVMS